jgi:hypothetical protein
MAEASYRTSALYRPFESELLVVHPSSGHFFYFSLSAKEFFDFFQKPRSVDDYYAAAGLKEDRREQAYLSPFVRELIGYGLLETVKRAPMLAFSDVKYCRPVLLRVEKEKLKEVALLCRISGPNSSESGT